MGTTSLTLLGRVAIHDQDAWRQLTTLYGPIVYSWCRSAGLQPDDSEDVGQEVFRVVAVKFDRFNPERKQTGAFRSWLWGITRLEILNHLRAVQRQPIGEGGSHHNQRLQSLEQLETEAKKRERRD